MTGSHFNYKKIGLVLGALALALFGYLVLFSGTGGDAAPVLTATGPGQDTILGHELLSALAELKSIKLDESFFADTVFQSLRDFGVTIAPQTVGRPNPFRPLDAGAGGAASLGASAQKKQ